MAEEFLYPPIEPYNSGMLQVSTIHKIYYEECGNKSGIPVVFLHGGPGGSTSNRDRRFFDPKAYRVIFFHQRGCGKSTPKYSTEENDTWNLLSDMERLRELLSIKKWLVFGGSWGSTLALLYAEAYIDRVLALILRGVFTFREEESKWLYQQGASYIFPEYWEEFLSPIPEVERDDLLTAYYKRINGTDKDAAIQCAKAFSIWDAATTRFLVNPDLIKATKETPSDEALDLAKFRMHFEINMGFLKSPNQILENAGIIRESGIPVTIVQGRYDVVCPAKTAWDLHKIIGNSELIWVNNGGHSKTEEGITKGLVEACDKYKKIVC